MRPKKDPGIRQEAFIRAATLLFMKKGYDAVSIRDVLDAVDDKTASPSVFYYYFSSKSDLYRACAESVASEYLKGLNKCFEEEGVSLNQRIMMLVSCLECYLLNENNLVRTGNSTDNYLFILDMREKVTDAIAVQWESYLPKWFDVPVSEAHALGQFLAGGMGKMIYRFVIDGYYGKSAVYALSYDILNFASSAIGLPKEQKAQLLSALNESHEKEPNNIL